MKKIYISLFVIIAIAISGCSLKSNVEQESMYSLGSSLTKLSSAIEGSVRYENPDKNLSDTDLLEFSTKHDDSLKEPFGEYKVKILNDNRHAVVLICSKDGTRALLEDAGCTAKLDIHHWQTKEITPCNFTISSNVCK